ncbi:Diaminopimelate epimerase-like protein [Meredithblackwellia eburnea MCA 4105]
MVAEKPASAFEYVLLDTMTQERYTGNPTPTFILDPSSPWPEEATLQKLSNELKQSEAAFVRLVEETETYLIKWFTPFAPEWLCGHGTVAAAMALHLANPLSKEFKFVTPKDVKLSAVLSSTPTNSSTDAKSFTVTFPSVPVAPSLVPDDIYKTKFAEALGIEASLILELSQNELRDIIIDLDPGVDFSAESMKIDPFKLLDASPPGTRSQVVTSRWTRSDEFEFAKRVFAYGGEDEATGSTYCCLGPYWSSKLGRSKLRAFQCSTRKGQATLEVTSDKVDCTAWAILCAKGIIYV